MPARRDLAGIDAVLLSHLHWDHLDVPSLRDVGRSTPILVPAGAGAWMQGAGFGHVQEIASGDVVDVGGVRDRGRAGPPLGVPAAARPDRAGGRLRRARLARRCTSPATPTCSRAWPASAAIDVALLPVWGWGPTLGRGLHMDPLRAAESLRRIRPRAAVPIHWGTYWPHAMGRVFPERRVEPPAAFAEYASELAPDVQVLLTEVGTTVAWRA